MQHRYDSAALKAALAGIDELLADLAAAGDRHSADFAAMSAPQREDARNLVHYLAARRHDLRPLQERLRELSLSSLGRMEPDVLPTVQGVQHVLQTLLGAHGAVAGANTMSAFTGDARLRANTTALLGPSGRDRQARIMVTLPSAAASDAALVCELVRTGMDTARINLAHDDADAWTRMAAHVRQAATDLGRPVRILADLPGTKLRTGAIAPGPRVVKVRPRRDVCGRCVQPATVVFTDPDAPPPATPGTVIPLRTALAAFVLPGDELVLRDARDRQRRFQVVTSHRDHCVATIDRTAYLPADAPLQLVRGITELAATRLGELPALPGGIALREHDVLLVTRDSHVGAPAETDAAGDAMPASVPCTLPQLFEVARADQTILFDDGRIAGVILANEGERLRVRITGARAGGAVLRAEKGINLPGTALPVPAVTGEDQGRLDWIAQHADLVGLSFVQRPEDVIMLQDELVQRRRGDLGVVLKIETAVAFQRLPELLLAGLRSPSLGVMVARGDLAVEVGFARLAEVQEEILWLCEAARVPVVWATQVLDSMARTGTPSRAEITDAAMSVRAECVMLNKGPYIVPTVAFLAGVLERMQQHTTKKRSLLRRLHVADSPAG